MTPAVTVLLPFYQAGPTLEAATLSLVEDPFTDVEVWLLDDGSDDSGVEVAQHLSQHPQIRWKRGPHRGLVDTLNRGLAEVTSPHVARMDADDISLPGRLTAQLRYLEQHPEVGVVDGLVEMWNPDGEVGGGMKHFGLWLNTLTDRAKLKSNLFVDSPLVHPATCAHTGLLRQLGGYVAGVPEDYHLWLRVVQARRELAKIPQPVLKWRDHSHRLTRTHPDYGRDRFFEVKWQFLHTLGILSPHRPLVVWGAGKEARPWLARLAAGAYPVVGVVDVDPAKQGTTRHSYPTYSIDKIMDLPWETGLIAVGAKGARELIVTWLKDHGIEVGGDFQGRNFWPVA